MRLLLVLLVLLIMSTIFYFSSIPDLHFIHPEALPAWLKSWVNQYTLKLGGQGFFSYTLSLHPDFIIHKLGHIALYGLLGSCLFLATNRSVGWSVFLTMIFAVSDELHQGYVSGRSSRFGDIALDVAAAVLFILLIRKLKQK